MKYWRRILLILGILLAPWVIEFVVIYLVVAVPPGWMTGKDYELSVASIMYAICTAITLVIGGVVTLLTRRSAKALDYQIAGFAVPAIVLCVAELYIIYGDRI